MSDEILRRIDERHIRHVIWRIDPQNEYAWQPGGFLEKLFDAYTHADLDNRARLALGFPDTFHPFYYSLKELVEEVQRRNG